MVTLRFLHKKTIMFSQEYKFWNFLKSSKIEKCQLFRNRFLYCGISLNVGTYTLGIVNFSFGLDKPNKCPNTFVDEYFSGKGGCFFGNVSIVIF